MDRGTETGIMATIHSYLRAQCGEMEDGTDCVLYGPSTQNKIERWWKDLLERMERFFGSIVVYRLTNYVIFVNRSPNVVVSFVGRII